MNRTSDGLIGPVAGVVDPGQTGLTEAGYMGGAAHRHTGARNLRAVGGFTLLEVLLCIALIALLGGVLVGSSSHLLTDKPVTPSAVFWKSVQEARKTALRAQHEIRLKYDREKKHFYLVDGLAPSTLAEDGITRTETPLKTFPIAPELAHDLTVDFLPASTKGGLTILVGGVLLESQGIKHVAFYADGTCAPFRVQLARSGGSTILTVDPWTCAPVLTPGDPNAPPSS
ncbi:MAG: hypothetical protein HZC55_24205 [Verrucomicrobia bacterium]|nr:hypothetical protein [Verrucomicrobiota bacterium]